MNILILQKVNCRAAAGVQELFLPCLCTAPSIKGNWLGQLVATLIQMLWIVSPSYSILLSEKRVLLFTRFIVDNKLLVPLCQLLTIRPGQSYLCTKGSRACAAAYTQCVRQKSCCRCMGWDNRVLWCVAEVLLWVFLLPLLGDCMYFIWLHICSLGFRLTITFCLYTSSLEVCCLFLT